MSTRRTERRLTWRGAGAVLAALIVGLTSCGRGSSDQQERTAMLTVTSRDGTSIGYWRSGTGPPLVLVHGTTADHSRWARILPDLESHFTVYAMDRRGRGGSDDHPEYTIAREFEDVAAVVDAIGEPVSLVGHSYGAICSLEAALRTPHVRRLVLYEPPIPLGDPIYPDGAPERVQALVDAGDREAALETFVRDVVQMPEHELAVYRTLPQWQVRVSLAPTIPRELLLDRTYTLERDRLAGLQTPTLLLLGGDSPPLFKDVIAVLDEVLPDSRVVVMPGQQHVAMDTAPDLFLRELLTFLRAE